MSEINSPKVSVNKVNFNNIQKSQNEIISEENKKEETAKISDLSDQKEVTGRSMLIKDADNVNHDLKALIENPQIADNSDKMFETAFKAAEQAGVANPYEEAATFATGNM